MYTTLGTPPDIPTLGETSAQTPLILWRKEEKPLRRHLSFFGRNRDNEARTIAHLRENVVDNEARSIARLWEKQEEERDNEARSILPLPVIKLINVLRS